MTPADFRARVEAVKQLGRKRSVEAVPLLIDGLMKLTPLTSGNILDFEESYPASAALVQIIQLWGMCCWSANPQWLKSQDVLK